MHEKLKAAPAPVITVQTDTDAIPSIKLTGRTYPLELFLSEMGFKKAGHGVLECEPEDMNAALTGVRELAEAYGWELNGDI